MQRPTTLPGQLPDGIAGNRPDVRPSRPGIGGDRPNLVGNRPGIGGNRPGIGDGNSLWNSGTIGSGNVALGNWTHNNNFTNVNVGGGWGLPGYGFDNGYGYGGWANRWNNGYVNPHYGGWYNGCWGGNWGSNGGWWAPFAAGAASWGLASTLSSWGWGYGAAGYANPYMAELPAAVVASSPYDYAEPVVVNNYVTNDGNLTDASVVQGGTAISESAQSASPSDASVDAALAAFRQGDYATALEDCDQAVREAPSDSVIHEVRALALFALGRYPEAAATLNAVLAVAPGMDWTTMSSLYGSVDDYTQQLRQLEDFSASNPDSAAGAFVLAYHYLVGGHAEMAAEELRLVVAKQPGDVVAARLLQAIAPSTDGPASSPSAGEREPVDPPAVASQAGPETDLVGTWIATTVGNDSIELVISEDARFTWKAVAAGQQPLEIAGMIETSRDAISLNSDSAGTLVAKVTSQGADAFEFTLAGGPTDAQPIAFRRRKP